MLVDGPTAGRSGGSSCSNSNRLFVVHGDTSSDVTRTVTCMLNFPLLPRSSTLSVIFISWSIFKPAWFPALAGCSAGCCGCWLLSCRHSPFTAAGSTTTTPSGAAVGSGGAGSVIFAACCSSRGASKMSHLGETGSLATWEGAGEGDTRTAAGPDASNSTASDQRAPEITGCSFQTKMDLLPE